MDDLNLTNDHLKEHLLGLVMTKGIVDCFENLPTQTKSSFTRSFNKVHKE
jgi:hypothetical protein